MFFRFYRQDFKKDQRLMGKKREIFSPQSPSEVTGEELVKKTCFWESCFGPIKQWEYDEDPILATQLAALCAVSSPLANSVISNTLLLVVGAEKKRDLPKKTNALLLALKKGNGELSLLKPIIVSH